MSTSAAHVAAFYRESVREEAVWAIRDAGGFPSPSTPAGYRAMPFWSSRTRAEKVILTVPAYEGFVPVEIALGDFRSRWLPGLERDGIRVGLNWAGTAASGYDLTAREVEENLGHAAGRGSAD